MSDAEDDLFGTADVDGWGRPVVQAIDHPNLETLLTETLDGVEDWHFCHDCRTYSTFKNETVSEMLATPTGKYLQALYDAVIALREADGPHWINLLDELFDAVDAMGEVE